MLIIFLSLSQCFGKLFYVPKTDDQKLHSPRIAVGVDDMINVDVLISDMQGAYLGAFDFNVNFDESVLAFDSYSLGSELGDISAGNADDWGFGYLGSGVLNLSELSWLWDLSSQPDEFTLATISFLGNGQGTSVLMLSDVILSDDWGYDLQAISESSSINVTSSVPEPATILLLSAGFIGLFSAKRRMGSVAHPMEEKHYIEKTAGGIKVKVRK
ncbi:MAG: PEP-CTERM sorting domain-containing protein [Bacteroidetes bacterium]|nr:PEP-CTERM sorting domain-containing protein [Bacteroidota bacterium]